MSLTLHLGVVDVPYEEGGKTTFDVANILEEKYHLVAHFVDAFTEQIADQLAESFAGACESMMMGAPMTLDVFGDAQEGIKHDFHKYLYQGIDERINIPNVPTQAALKGYSKRFRRGKGARRPSFIDTGLLESSFKAWID